MQFHLDGYRPGDPLVEPADPRVQDVAAGPPAEADVVIVGCGPAGSVLAAQLAHFPEITTVVVDQREQPLGVGQADGVACRTVEMLEAFGLAGRLLDEAYWVNHVAFWQPSTDARERIVRTGRTQDTEDGLSEFPHVIVNQARVQAWLHDHAERSPSRLRPHYGWRAEDVTVVSDDDADRPVSVTLRRVLDGAETGEVITVRARYVVGCDGARSTVRAAIGQRLVGDSMDQAWGVIDALVTTDFPDIRLKCAIRSANDGNLLIIPREGGYLVRMYIELDAAKDRDLLADRSSITPQKLAAVINRVLNPYTLEVKDVGWWSVYDVGQRLCDRFDDLPADTVPTATPRVFIAGDACHTHSAKAGQGMNVSMADAWNLGWKLAAVLREQARPDLLLTYSEERQAIAAELIAFDREFASRFSAPPETPGQDSRADEFQQYFLRQGRFTAGVATQYAPSMITASGTHQHLAPGFAIGTRFHSAPVIRAADAKAMSLGHVARADGAWRLYVFADSCAPGAEQSRARSLCEFLASERSPVLRYTSIHSERDAVIDVRGVFQQQWEDLAVETIPAALLPRKGRFGLIDHEKVFCADPGSGDIFDLRGIARDAGCVVVVRPDQYVAHVLPLDAQDELAAFFAGILKPPAKSHADGD